jgi:hypothetical protein
LIFTKITILNEAGKQIIDTFSPQLIFRFHLSDLVEQNIIKVEKQHTNVIRHFDIKKAVKQRDEKCAIALDLMNESYLALSGMVVYTTDRATLGLPPPQQQLIEQEQNKILMSHELKPVFEIKKELPYISGVSVSVEDIELLKVVHQGQNSVVWKVSIKGTIAILKISNAIGNDFFEHYLYK